MAATATATAHVDSFVRDRLPAPEALPDFIFELPELQFPDRLNCAALLLDDAVARGWGDRRCVIGADGSTWTYTGLLAQVNRIANVLVHDMGLVSGNRVLLRAPNSPMLAACWFAVVKAGGIAVGTMPMLRATELGQIIAKAQVTHALCDASLAAELAQAAAVQPVLREVRHFGLAGEHSLEARAARQPDTFTTLDTAADDPCLLAFTSGTTGQPKATAHLHRDVMAACACFAPHVLRPLHDPDASGLAPVAARRARRLRHARAVSRNGRGRPTMPPRRLAGCRQTVRCRDRAQGSRAWTDALRAAARAGFGATCRRSCVNAVRVCARPAWSRSSRPIRFGD